MTAHLWVWWQGYVTICLRGPGLERLLNRATDLEIAFFEVERLTADVMIARLRVKDFRRLRPLLWGSHISVTISDRHGAPFLLRRLKPRAFLWVGLLLSLLGMVYLSNFIWFIEIVGNESLSPAILKVAAEDLGLQVGMARQSIAPRQIEAALLARFPVLAWAQVRLKGVKVEVYFAEREGVEADLGGAGHVYARADGIVTEVLVLRGTSQIEEGDTVRKDDLLISGVYYDSRGRKQFGAAQGIIRARVWYQGVGEAPLIKWEPVKTGRTHRQYIVNIGSLKIPLGRSYPLETHLKDAKERSLSLGSAMVPLRWMQVDYEEVQYIPVSVPREEAQAEAYGLAWESLTARGLERDKVLKERTEQDVILDQEGIRITVWVEVEEDIGQFFSQ